MKRASQAASAGTIGLGGAVFLLFLGFKLAGLISWSWWWVTVPLWGPMVFVVVIFAAGFVVYLLARLLDSRQRQRQRLQARRRP
jgi:membrane protein implicated in regulation of membrane protease activity